MAQMNPAVLGQIFKSLSQVMDAAAKTMGHVASS